MFGCLRKIGCLVILLAAVAGYFWYKQWAGRSTTVDVAPGTWVAVSSADAETGRKVIEALQGTSGEVFASLTPAQAVSYLLQRSSAKFLANAEGMQAMVTGDTLHVKSVISLDDFGGAEVLGPLASVLNTRDTVQLSGVVRLLPPAAAQLRVTDARVHNLRIPRGAIPKLIGQIRRNDTIPGVAPDGLPFPLPSYIAEIRISNGKVILYKNI